MSTRNRDRSSMIGVGIAIGTALGVAFGNIGLGIALGLLFGAALSRKNGRSQDGEGANPDGGPISSRDAGDGSAD